MRFPRSRYAWGAIVALATVTALPGCSGDAQPTAVQAPATLPSPSIAPISEVPSALATPTERLYVSPTPTSVPQFNQISGLAFSYKPGRAPRSAQRNGAIQAPDYVQNVMVLYKDIWRTGLASQGMDTPRLVYDITAFGDAYQSKCYTAGRSIVVKPNATAMLYCSLDAPPDGAIAIPTSPLAEIWSQTNRAQGDLSVAISITRQATLITLSSLSSQLGLPPASDLSRQYTAACLSGAWAHAVYPQSMFTEKDISVALARSFAVPTIGDGPTASLANDQQAVTAWIVGFRGGAVDECGHQFWR